MIELMNNKVEGEEYNDALQYLEQLIQLCVEIKNNDVKKHDLSIVNYTDMIINWDLYIEAWVLYEEYLN